MPVSVSVVGNDDVSCADISTRLILDADGATYELDTMVGCEGALAIELPDGLDANDLRSYTIEANYELDAGAEVRSLVESSTTVTLQPHRKQAEHHDPDSSIRTEATGDTEGGGLNVGWIRSGFSMAYSDVNLSGIDSMRFRIASNSKLPARWGRRCGVHLRPGGRPGVGR